MRPTTADDIDAVVALLAAVAAEDRWIATEVPFDVGLRRARMREMLDRSDAHSLVALSADALVGNLGAHARRRGVFEFGMVVAKDWRGRGVGSELLAACIAWARASGAHKITLEVFPDNTAARAFYAKFGFVEEGYFRSHLRRKNGELRDCIPMGLLLDSD